MNLIKRKIVVKKVENTSIERHPVYILGTDYKVKIVYKNVKVPELDLENKTIKISLPNKFKKTENTKVLDFAIEKLYEQIAKVEIERAMEKMRIALGFAPEDYKIKNMKNELGRCEDNRIIINPKIVCIRPILFSTVQYKLFLLMKSVVSHSLYNHSVKLRHLPTMAILPFCVF